MNKPLNASEIEALEATLDDEYKSFETFAQVIADFGKIRPFISIFNAEHRHSTALLRVFEQCGR